MMHKNRARRKENAARRLVAARKQTPLHMRGLAPHPYHNGITDGQLDRAEKNAKAKQARYPFAPVYRTYVSSSV